MNNHHERIEKLQKMARSGELTYSDVRKKLTIAIEKEYQSDHPNIDFINACEDMLWEIGTQNKQKFVSANTRYLEVIRNNTKPKKEPFIPHIPTKRLAMVLSAFVIVLLLCGVSFRWQWFAHHVSPDNEQYVIQGQSIDISLITQCIAEHNHEDKIRTDDWNTLISFLGFEPVVINPNAISASAVQYKAYIEPDAVHVDALYSLDEQDRSLLLSMRSFTDVEEAYFAIEQDMHGEESVIEPFTLYINVNQEHCSLTWIEGITVYHISGQFDTEQGLDIAQRYIRGKEND